jgi:hypothetical protein
MAKAACNKKTLFTSKLDVHLRKKLIKCYIWSAAFYGANTWTLRKVHQKHLGSFEIWCWKRMDNVSWINRVRNEELLHRVKENGNILHTLNRKKAKWIGHVLLSKCLLKHVIEGKTKGIIEVTGRRGR